MTAVSVSSAHRPLDAGTRVFVSKGLRRRTIVYALAARFADERGLTTLSLCFLIPGLPDDVIRFVGGLTDIDPKKPIAVAVVGRFPGFLLVNLAGAEVTAARHPEVAVVLFALSAIGYRWRGAILDRLRGRE